MAGPFFLSGVAALVYQVAWQRILALLSGVGIYSVAMIVAAFMAGLGLGSLWGGRLSARAGAGRALRLFAALELGVAAFGALSCALFYDLLRGHAAVLYASPWGAGLFHFLALAVPTSLMGMSLPFLVRATVRDAPSAARTIGSLYAVNLLGASCGALITPWILMRFLGLRGTVLAAAACNVAAGLGALWLARRTRAAGGREPRPTAMALAIPPTPPLASAESGESLEPPRSFALWAALYALSGFCALGLEILWFRLIDVAVKSSAFTFGTVLCVYLLGSGIGACVGAARAPRLRRPLRAFLACQCALSIYSGLAVLALARLPIGWMPAFHAYWAQYDGITLGKGGDAGLVLALYLLLPIGLYGPPTVLMGLSFPILQRAVQDDPLTSGRKVGLLQAANILGCTLGSLAVGLLALDRLGTPGSLRALMLLGAAFALVGLRDRDARGAFALCAAGLAGLCFALPGADALWPRLHGAPAADTLAAEDASGLAAVTPEAGGGFRLSVNGKGNGQLPFADLHAQLGAAPALIHPAPREIALIGLGSGATAWAAALRAETERVDVFEIVAPETRVLERLSARAALPQLRRLLEDPRIRVVVADGRNALERTPRLYDVIEADALRPQGAYAGNLYSLEFFRACAARLRRGGLVCTWSPTNRVYATLSHALPHVVELDEGRLLVGSNEPVDVDLAAWRRRLDQPSVRRYLGAELAEQVWSSLERARLGRPRARHRSDVNLDLFPRDELLSP